MTQFCYTGVSFFFVLSGFVLTWSAREHDSTRAYAWRRFGRVWPAHAVTTLAIIPVILLEGGNINWVALPAVLLLVQAWVPFGSWHYAFNAQSWSLSDEAFFYALFPLFMIAQRWKARALRFSLATVVVLLVLIPVATLLLLPEYSWSYVLYINPLYRLGDFALGVIMGLAFRRGWRPPWRTSHAVAAFAVSYTALLLASTVVNERVPVGIGGLVLLPSFLMLIGAAAKADLADEHGLLTTRFMVRLGEWSFALYLVHQAVIRVARVVLDGHLSTEGWTALWLPIIVVSILLSGMLYNYVEKPLERAIRRRTNKPRPVRSPTSRRVATPDP